MALEVQSPVRGLPLEAPCPSGGKELFSSLPVGTSFGDVTSVLREEHSVHRVEASRSFKDLSDVPQLSVAGLAIKDLSEEATLEAIAATRIKLSCLAHHAIDS